MIDLDYGSGFVRMRRAVYRALRDARDDATMKVWLELEDRARFSSSGPMPGRRGRVVDLQIGQAACGYHDLAKVLDLSVQKVRTALAKLKKLGVIVINSATKSGTVLTLVGFTENADTSRSDQQSEQQSEQQRAHKEPTRNGDRDTSDLSLIGGLDLVPPGLPDPPPVVRADREVLPPPDEPPPGMELELPETWRPLPEPEIERVALVAGVDIDAQLARLRDHARARGTTSSDWQASWRTWLSRAIDWARDRRSEPAKNPATERRAARPRVPTMADAERSRLLELPATVRTPRLPSETHEEWCRREQAERQALQYGVAP